MGFSLTDSFSNEVQDKDVPYPHSSALAIEPLAESIRLDNGICDMQIGDVEHKISLYADDTLLDLSNAEVSVPAALNCITEFSRLSGYKINLNLMPDF